MGLISIRIEGVERITRKLNCIQRGLGDRAAAMALNKTASKARTEMTRAITSEYNLRASEVRARLRILRARRGRLVAQLDPFAGGRPGRSMNVIRFLERKVTLAEARRRRRSGTQNVLRFRIKRRGGVKIIPGAFIGNRGRTVFRRVGRTRLPIEPVQTIDVPQMFNARRINVRVIARIRRELPVEMERAVRHVLRSVR